MGTVSTISGDMPLLINSSEICAFSFRYGFAPWSPGRTIPLPCYSTPLISIKGTIIIGKPYEHPGGRRSKNGALFHE
jgi:hypothetical protein